MSKYVRKYYLHQRVKASGCVVELRQQTKTVMIPPEIIIDKYVMELKDKYSYGVQYINPLYHDKNIEN